MRRKGESIQAYRKRRERMSEQGKKNTAKLKKFGSKIKSAITGKGKVTGTGKQVVGRGKNARLNVTKEQLSASGMTLTGYANYMKKNDGKRPPAKPAAKVKPKAKSRSNASTSRATSGSPNSSGGRTGKVKNNKKANTSTTASNAAKLQEQKKKRTRRQMRTGR